MRPALQSMENSESIEMHFGPLWPYVSTIRVFAQNFFSIATGDRTKAEKISMSISELVENAVKFSTSGEAYLKISMGGDSDSIWVVVKNETDEVQGQMLLDFLSFLNSLPPLDAYIEMMRRSAASGRSQLGLARIRYEAGGQISASVDDRYHVTIQANFPAPEQDDGSTVYQQ